MDVKELKKRWIRGLICPPLFYLPVKQTEYKDIIIKCVHDGQEYPLITSIGISSGYNMTPQYNYSNLVYNEETSSYEGSKYYDPCTKQYFNTLNEAMISYYQHRIYTWVDKQGRTQGGYVETNVTYSEDKTFKDGNELRYPTIEWEKYSTIINFIENPVEIIVDGEHEDQYYLTSCSFSFNSLQSYIIIKNLKPGIYSFYVNVSSDQSDYPIDDRKTYSGIELIQPENWDEEYSGTFYDETGYDHRYSPYGSNYYNISPDGSISRFGWHNREYSYTKYSDGQWSNSRPVADEFFGTKAPYKDNTLVYELGWRWITQNIYCKSYYKKSEDYNYFTPSLETISGGSGYAIYPTSYSYSQRHNYSTSILEYYENTGVVLNNDCGIIEFKNLIYEEENTVSALSYQYYNNIAPIGLKVGEYSYEITQGPVYVRNYWGDSTLYYKLDKVEGNTTVTITKTSSSNPQNNPLLFYFSPEKVIRVVYCQIDGYSAFKMYIDQEYKGYFQMGELYYNNNPVCPKGFLKYEMDKVTGNDCIKYSRFIFEDEDEPSEVGSNFNYHDVRNKELLTIRYKNFNFSTSCSRNSSYLPNGSYSWRWWDTFYGIPIAIWKENIGWPSGSTVSFDTDWKKCWNCYNDTNGINYDNKTCQIYYYLKDGLTKENLGLMFSGFNRIVVEQEDE